MQGVISTPYTKFSEQFADIFIKGLSVETYEFLCNKLGMITYMLQLEGEC